MNATFKQAQLLPVLTSGMFVGEAKTNPFGPTGVRRAARQESRIVTPRAATRQLPRPRGDDSKAERALFAILALSAVSCVGSAFTTMIELTPHWPAFQAWVTRLLS